MSGQPSNVASATPQPVASASPSVSVMPTPSPLIYTTHPIQTKESHAKQPPELGKIDINTATEKELRSVPGIGPMIAARIIAARPFRSADDLKKVNGIGEKKYKKIRPYFN